VSADLKPLQDCPGLQVLVLDHTETNDVSTLSVLGKLRFLNISHTNVMNVSSLPPTIKALNIDDTGIASVPFASLSSLTHVMWSTTFVSSIAGIERCSQLEFIRLSNTYVSDITPLQYCTKLWNVNLRHTDVTDVSCLETLTNITGFACSWNHVVGMSYYAPQPMFHYW